VPRAYVKRDLYSWKETNRYECKETLKRDLLVLYHTVSASSIRHICQKRPISMERDLQIWMKSDLKTRSAHLLSYRQCLEHATHLWKETYTYGKRPINMNANQALKKRSTDFVSYRQCLKQTYKRDLLICIRLFSYICIKKRRAYMKRDLHKRPIDSLCLK